MSLFVIPVAVAVIGKMLGDSKNPRSRIDIRDENRIPLSALPSSSDRSREVDLYEKKVASQRWKEAQYPSHTNVIPGEYNQFYSETGQPVLPQYYNNDQPRPIQDSTLPAFTHLSRADLVQRENSIFKGPMFIKEARLGYADNENDYTQESASMYPHRADAAVVYTDPNTHNNMVPFFGSNATQNMSPDAHATTLENFTGTGEIMDKHKSETETMFAPRPENIFGTPAVPEEYRKNRYVQSNLKTSLLPVPQVRVAPMSEFEENFRPYTKNIDALRAKTNPKISFTGRPLGPAQGAEQRGFIGKVGKNTPEGTFYIGDDYVIPAPSAYQAIKMDEDFTTAMKCTQRENEPVSTGHPGPITYIAGVPRLKRKRVKEFKTRGENAKYTPPPL
jgi:hypothetical protein